MFHDGTGDGAGFTLVQATAMSRSVEIPVVMLKDKADLFSLLVRAGEDYESVVVELAVRNGNEGLVAAAVASAACAERGEMGTRRLSPSREGGRMPGSGYSTEQIGKGIGTSVYDVFISHASEDKDTFVRPLAVALDALGVRLAERQRLFQSGTVWVKRKSLPSALPSPTSLQSARTNPPLRMWRYRLLRPCAPTFTDRTRGASWQSLPAAMPSGHCRLNSIPCARTWLNSSARTAVRFRSSTDSMALMKTRSKSPFMNAVIMSKTAHRFGCATATRTFPALMNTTWNITNTPEAFGNAPHGRRPNTRTSIDLAQ